MYMPQDIEKILLSEEQIKARVAEMAGEITREYADKHPLFICVLKGSVVFFSDLIRGVECPLDIDFLRASSYGSSDTSSGNVRLSGGSTVRIEGRHVIVVEDILDTARTLFALKNELLKQHPASLKIATLLDKPSRRVVTGFTADYTGFCIEDYFVVGYGMDYDEKYRHLPYIGVVKT